MKKNKKKKKKGNGSRSETSSTIYTVELLKVEPNLSITWHKD